MNTISYKDLKDFYLNSADAKGNAKKYFGSKQPSVYYTGYYSAPSWNWAYQLGIVGVIGTGLIHTTSEGLEYGNDIEPGVIRYFEVVTQFGGVVAARQINLPMLGQ
jgi:hypothetical protein